MRILDPKNTLKFYGWMYFTGIMAFLLFVAAVEMPLPSVHAQNVEQATFASPEQAGQAFFVASQSDNDQALLKILGPEGRDIISSGDPAEDKAARAAFAEKYQEMHRFTRKADGTRTLVVGAENWPLPFPLVSKDGVWHFDTEAGKDEVLFRRIGENETVAIMACEELVEAQKQFHAKGSAEQFAQKLVSDEGKQNGLYTKGTGDAAGNAALPFIAQAYAQDSGKPAPFKGYFFRVLTERGAQAPGGAKNYVVAGKMTEGFAFVAYPAEYRSSGVMTFVVDDSGIVYEKDLGPETTKFAESMAAFNPDSSWKRVE